VNLRRLLVSLAAVSLLVAPVPGQVAKEKDKAKSKPAPRSFTDEDLKKYQDKAKEESTGTQTGTPTATPTESASPQSEPEGAPKRGGWRRRGAEYGGDQQASPPSASHDQVQEAPPTDAVDPKSGEEAEWKGRAAVARRPVDDAQSRIAAIEGEMAQLKEQLNPMSTNYILGGTSTAGVDAILELEQKLQNLETQRVDVKAELAEAAKGWQGFLEEARAAGASPAWLTP
jgi:hypothetical protein